MGESTARHMNLKLDLTSRHKDSNHGEIFITYAVMITFLKSQTGTSITVAAVTTPLAVLSFKRYVTSRMRSLYSADKELKFAIRSAVPCIQNTLPMLKVKRLCFS